MKIEVEKLGLVNRDTQGLTLLSNLLVLRDRENEKGEGKER